MDYIHELFAERIGGKSFGSRSELFKFEKIKRAKRMAAAEHPEMELIDLGVGEPDETANENIIQELGKQSYVWANRGYADNGIIDFQNAASVYMEKVYGVMGLMPENEILHVMGSKSALSMLPQAFINPGDITLITVPGYPIIGTMTEWLGGTIYQLPLKAENRYLPELEKIPAEIADRAKLFYINYPNNPTGSTATVEFYEEIITFAREHHIIIIQDAAYAALTYWGKKPLSFLALPGGKEVGIELHSLSKAFNMTGWRLGFACGNADIISALAAVKDNNDSGQFKAIQYAGVYALLHPEITQSYVKKYERRHKKLAAALREVGFDVSIPEASFYQYARIPKGTRDGIIFENAEQFAQLLIRKALVSVVPWDDAGNYVRFSVTFVAGNSEDEDRIIKEMTKRMKNMRFIF